MLKQHEKKEPRQKKKDERKKLLKCVYEAIQSPFGCVRRVELLLEIRADNEARKTVDSQHLLFSRASTCVAVNISPPSLDDSPSVFDVLSH